MKGTAVLSFTRPDPAAPLLLDSQGLVIERIDGSDGRPRPWRLGPADPRLGAALSVPLQPQDSSIRIAYHTGRDAAALQWLAPEQTHDGRQPFLFTQGEAIFTRTWIPLQGFSVGKRLNVPLLRTRTTLHFWTYVR